jgi:cytoskeleton protein RodZ
MFCVGEALRRARLEQGLDLCTLAARTKINIKYLEAIESDDRKSLPSSFFYRSFVQQYAKSLSLDTREIDAEVDHVLSADSPLPFPGHESAAARNVPPLTFAPRFHSRRRYASAAAFVPVVVGCSGVYTLWRNWKSAPKQPAVRVVHPAAQATPPRRFAQPTSTPEASVTLASVTRAFEPALPGYKVMLDLLAHEVTWVSVSSDGKPVFSGILQPNQSKSVDSKQSAKMLVGNAAGIEVRLNGKLLGPLGVRGQVLIVLFTPDNFQIFSPQKESD